MSYKVRKLGTFLLGHVCRKRNLTVSTPTCAFNLLKVIKTKLAQRLIGSFLRLWCFKGV